MKRYALPILLASALLGTVAKAQTSSSTPIIGYYKFDVAPGGASAYILQQIIETQAGYWHLDAPPRTITAQPHRPAYTSDGDYASKPNAEDVFLAALDVMKQ